MMLHKPNRNTISCAAGNSIRSYFFPLKNWGYGDHWIPGAPNRSSPPPISTGLNPINSIKSLTELDDGKICRNPLYLMVKTLVDFPLNQSSESHEGKIPRSLPPFIHIHSMVLAPRRSKGCKPQRRATGANACPTPLSWLTGAGGAWRSRFGGIVPYVPSIQFMVILGHL